MKKTKLSLYYVTCPSKKVAKQIARSCLQNHIAACANILPQMKSLYWWDKKIQESNEVVLILKSNPRHSKILSSIIKKLHPYTCVCILEFKVSKCNPDYEKWLMAQLIKA